MLKTFGQAEFSKREFIVIIFFSAILIAGIGLKYIKENHWNLESTEVVNLARGKTSYRIDINKADWHELMLLPGIGKARAKAIIEYRHKHGDIHSIDELSNIKGIGDSILNSVRDLIIIKKG